jgi:hypothetical protein
MSLTEAVRAGNAEPEITHALARLVVDEHMRALGMCLIPMRPTLDALEFPTAAHTRNRAGPRIIFEVMPVNSGEYPNTRMGALWVLAQGDPADLPYLHPQIFQPLAVYFGMPGE